MVYTVGVQNSLNTTKKNLSFGKKDSDKKSVCENHDRLMVEEKTKHPITTSLKIGSTKLVNAFTKYPKKGFKGSKNANFYEFLTMGTVPYLLGSASMMAVFNVARKYFDTPAAKNAAKLGNRMALGVVAYGLMKNLSKKFIETPVKMARGIDVNIPYDKVVYELPEDGNKSDLVSHEYHKAYESVDFPRWDLFYNNKHYGDERNSYYKKICKKFGHNPDDVNYSDQKIKQSIKETVVKTKFFSTVSSYLWAGLGVGMAMQEPWTKMTFNPMQRLQNLKNNKKVVQMAAEKGNNNVGKYEYFIQEFGKKLGKSFEEFIGVDFGKIVKNIKNKEAITKGMQKATKTQIAGRVFLGAAVGMTLLGNFFAIHDFNKDRGSKTQASTSLIDDNREKVVC